MHKYNELVILQQKKIEELQSEYFKLIEEGNEYYTVAVLDEITIASSPARLLWKETDT